MCNVYIFDSYSHFYFTSLFLIYPDFGHNDFSYGSVELKNCLCFVFTILELDGQANWNYNIFFDSCPIIKWNKQK